MKDYTVVDCMNFVHESMLISEPWRARSYQSEMFRDGDQWSYQREQEAIQAGIDPSTNNRIFPVINFLRGTQALNQQDITAKGRTQADTEIGGVMTEGIKYVVDENDGLYLTSDAFDGAIVPGISFVEVKHNNDPRREKIQLALRNYKDMGWDQFGDPWLDPVHCKYVYHQPWCDLEELIALYPEHERELNDIFSEYGMQPWGTLPRATVQDEATLIEELKMRTAISSYQRKRVRPVYMWYPIYEPGVFVKYPNGDWEEITRQDIMNDPLGTKAKVDGGVEVIKANVPRMKFKTFLGHLELDGGYTPYSHDEYPFVPFIGYLDRYRYPYGVPYQIIGPQIDLNKRRAMVIALLKARRVIIEEDAVQDADALQKAYEEANKIDSFLVVKSGAIGAGKIKITEYVDIERAQLELLLSDEKEIKEVSGANDENMGWKGQALSGVAIDRRQAQGNTMNATLFNNLRRSKKKMGELIVAEIQGQWTKPKILRITDRMTGADKFAVLNERIVGPDGRMTVRNNVTRGKFDIIISDAPASDTVREQYLNLIIEWVKKSPPEIVPYLMNMAMEMSDLPNKEQLLDRLRPILGIDPNDEQMSAEERKAKTLQVLEAQRQAQEQQRKIQETGVALEMEGKKLSNDKIRAEIASIYGKVKKEKDDQDLKGVKTGFDMQMELEEKKRQAELGEGYQKAIAAGEKG